MVPAAFVHLDALPQTPTGKLDPRTLPAPTYGITGRDVEPAANALERRLLDIWEALLGVQPIGPTQDFFELGGNSLLALRLFAQIRDRLHCDLPVAILFTGATVRQMATAIEERAHSAPTARVPIVPLQPNGTLPPLFCVHPAGRQVHGYVQLVRHLGPDQPVFGIADAGDDLGRPLTQIASEHIRAVRSVQPNGPYYLLGWSFGGTVAYEMAVQLEQQGHHAAFVGVMDTMEPARWLAMPARSDADWIVRLARGVAAQMGRTFSYRHEPLEGLDLDEQCHRALEALQQQGAAPPNFSVASLREDFDIVKARARSEHGYEPGRFPGALTLFRPTEVPADPQPTSASSLTEWDEVERTFGWCRLMPGRVTVYRVPGAHITMGREPHVAVLAERMREALAAARARAGFELPA